MWLCYFGFVNYVEQEWLLVEQFDGEILIVFEWLCEVFKMWEDFVSFEYVVDIIILFDGNKMCEFILWCVGGYQCIVCDLVYEECWMVIDVMWEGCQRFFFGNFRVR